jgi:hypothetical protein
MEQDQSSSLFEMDIDSTDQAYLLSVSKWTRMIAITGFVVCGLMLLLLAAFGSRIATLIASLSGLGQGNLAGILIAVIIVVFAYAAIWLYFLFKSSNLLKKGLQNRSTIDLAEGFKAMRIYFVLSMIISTISILGTISGMFA